MGAAMGAGGGNCNKLARTGVAALLNAAVFGNKYLQFTGYASFSALYADIAAHFNSCNYEPLATNLDNANNLDHSLCSGLPGTMLPPPTIARASGVVSEATTSGLSVNAHPNPFTNKVSFRIISPVTGEVTLAIYNVTGQRIGIVYQGRVEAGVIKDVEYNAPAAAKGMLFYRLVQGDKNVEGKIIKME
jgi:hypothetical protein